ncbi:hypothetical protein [Acetobacter tropicalis]|uniref:hypothetical protein n=1 Tax=Acetobacter tropicalis TaxID=104102 RepID=UPI000AB462CC|nr:hypothetical protein [Acetobacter tropicalis]KAA8386675.1 hypothetical protein FOH22_11165 [Acetobacter tropicalis]MBC9009892.1 hypothetical protein [Acetobacter tropicalis]
MVSAPEDATEEGHQVQLPAEEERPREHTEPSSPVAPPVSELPPIPAPPEDAVPVETVRGEPLVGSEQSVSAPVYAEPAAGQPEAVKEPAGHTGATRAFQQEAASAYQQVKAAGAGVAERVAGAGSLRDMMVRDVFWRRAWIASFIVAIIVLVAGWHWWNAIVHVWPAAGRLHQAG